MLSKSDRLQSPHPAELYDQVWGVVNGCFFNVGALRNWGRWRYRFDNRIHSVKDAIDASNEMLSSLNERFTQLRSSARSEQRAYEETANAAVFSQGIADGIALIEVTSFNVEGMERELATALDRLPRSCRGIIIDLRRNAGGILREANRAAALFLDEGCTMREIRRAGFRFSEDLWSVTPTHICRRTVKGDELTVHSEDRLPNLAGDIPVAVLVGPGTASAAEVFAAALAENGRACLIGCETAGKGITQSRVTLLFDAMLDLTVGRFFSPHGHWFGDAGQTCAYGIRPHIVAGTDALLVARSWLVTESSRYFAA